MSFLTGLKAFFLPAITRSYLIRTAGVAGAAVLLFTFVLIPFRIQGHSMETAYRDGQVNFCFRLADL